LIAKLPAGPPGALERVLHSPFAFLFVAAQPPSQPQQRRQLGSHLASESVIRRGCG
jgi:hypothetical protein